MEHLTLHNEFFDVVVSPHAAGSLLALQVKRKDESVFNLLRKLPVAQPLSGRQAGAYACYEYFGRLPGSRVHWRGATYFVPHVLPFGLHGLRVDEPFAAERKSDHELRLHSTMPPKYPFDHHAFLKYRLEGRALITTIGIRCGENPGVFGPAWHPFFVNDRGNPLTLKARASVVFNVEGVDPIPFIPPSLIERGAPEDFSEGRPPGNFGDRCLGGWTGEAELSWANGVRVLMSSPCRYLHIFTGYEETTAIEPATIPPNGFYFAEFKILPAQEARVELRPGEVFEHSIKIQLLAA